ncbi:MAG TPA: DUF6162 family protein [Candidatus Dormibacteraeota bacterium]|nr:DUF6162 family protein [Candidatus Dormibacteraeota bacterium]
MTASTPARRRWNPFATPRPEEWTVEVAPASDGDEEVWVFLTAGFVCLCVIYVLIFQLYGGGKAQTLNTALPYQVLFRDLPSPAQRIFREMQEGVTEAVRVRASDGGWPTVESLASAGIPPFAADALDKAGLRWERRDDGLVTSYLGVPTRGAEMPAFLILIVEPAPGAGEQPAPAVVDEEHQLLPDGTLLHVTYWQHAAASLPAAITADPALQGWSQIRVSSPFQTVEGQ